MDELKKALEFILKEHNIELPAFGNIQIIFRDGNPFDIIKEERIRL